MNCVEAGCHQFTARRQRHIVSAIVKADTLAVVVCSDGNVWTTASVSRRSLVPNRDCPTIRSLYSGRKYRQRVKLLPGGQLGYALASRSVGSCSCYCRLSWPLNILTNTGSFHVTHAIVVTASRHSVLGRTCPASKQVNDPQTVIIMSESAIHF